MRSKRKGSLAAFKGLPLFLSFLPSVPHYRHCYLAVLSKNSRTILLCKCGEHNMKTYCEREAYALLRQNLFMDKPWRNFTSKCAQLASFQFVNLLEGFPAIKGVLKPLGLTVYFLFLDQLSRTVTAVARKRLKFTQKG